MNSSVDSYRNTYEGRKQSVADMIKRTSDFLRRYDRNAEADTLDDLRESVQNDLFSIVLVGEFSAGKSTFLNALMGQRLLPSFSGETTATVNFLQGKDQAEHGEAGNVYYVDGHVDTLSEVSLETLEKVVTTRGKNDGRNVAEDIDHVDLYLDSPFLQDGVRLVDSPGLNGIMEHHRQITEKQILKSHASIFVFNADHPGSQTDFSILKKLKELSTRLFIVLNKIDTIRENEGESPESVVEHLKQAYRQQFPEEGDALPEIWPISAYQALCARDDRVEYRNHPTTDSQRKELEQTSRLESFERRLWKYLTEGEKAREQLTEPIKTCTAKLLEQKRRISDQLEVLRCAGTETRETLTKDLEKLEGRIQELQVSQKKADAVFRSQIRSIVESAKEKAANDAGNLSLRMKNKMDAFADYTEISQYAETIDSRLAREYLRIATEVESQLSQSIQDAITDSCEQYFADLEDEFEAVAETGNWQMEFNKPDIGQDNVRKIGLEAFEKQQQALNDEIARTEQELDKLDKEKLTNQVMMSRLNNLEQDLRDAKDRRIAVESIALPSAFEEQRSVAHREGRGGVMGTVADFLFGPRTRVERTTVLNTSARDMVKEQQQQDLDRLDQTIFDIQRRIDQIQQKMTQQDSRRTDSRSRRKEKEYAALLEQRKQQHQAIMGALDKEGEAQRRRGVRALKDYIEEMAREFESTMNSHLIRQEKRYREVARELLNGTLNAELEKECDRRKELIATMDGTVAEREKSVVEAEQALDELKELIAAANELTARLQVEMNDQIGQG